MINNVRFTFSVEFTMSIEQEKVELVTLNTIVSVVHRRLDETHHPPRNIRRHPSWIVFSHLRAVACKTLSGYGGGRVWRDLGLPWSFVGGFVPPVEASQGTWFSWKVTHSWRGSESVMMVFSGFGGEGSRSRRRRRSIRDTRHRDLQVKEERRSLSCPLSLPRGSSQPIFSCFDLCHPD